MAGGSRIWGLGFRIQGLRSRISDSGWRVAGSSISGFGGRVYTGLLSNQAEKKYKLVFHNGSLKKKVFKYGTPKPSTGTRALAL